MDYVGIYFPYFSTQPSRCDKIPWVEQKLEEPHEILLVLESQCRYGYAGQFGEQLALLLEYDVLSPQILVMIMYDQYAHSRLSNVWKIRINHC